MKIPATSNYQCLEQASQWFAVLMDESVTEADKQAWQTWLNESTKHRLAWQQVESVGAMFSSNQDKHVQRSIVRVLESSRASSLNRRQALKGVMGLTGLSLLGWLGWEKTPLPRLVQSWNTDFHAGVGEVATYDLADGTKVWLNTNTAVNKMSNLASSNLDLLTGEIMIRTRPSNQNTFSVSCEHGLVSTKQGRFCLRSLSSEKAILSVYEGEVFLIPKHLNGAVQIRAGQEVIFDASSLASTSSVTALYESWTKGLLVVDNMPLSDFVNELSRYQYGYINLDEKIADLRVVGTFPTKDISLALSMLSASFPIQVKTRLPWWTAISAA